MRTQTTARPTGCILPNRVDGQDYTVTTDYVSARIPASDHTVTVKYDPGHPERVVFPEQEANVPLLIAGIAFLLFPLTILALRKRNVRFFLILLGAVFAAFGFLFYFLHLSLALTILFAGAGVFIIVRGIAWKRNKDQDGDLVD